MLTQFDQVQMACLNDLALPGYLTWVGYLAKPGYPAACKNKHSHDFHFPFTWNFHPVPSGRRRNDFLHVNRDRRDILHCRDNIDIGK